MDISGEHQTEFEHQVTKTRIDKNGNIISKVQGGREYLFSGLCIPLILIRSLQNSKEILKGPT